MNKRIIFVFMKRYAILEIFAGILAIIYGMTQYVSSFVSNNPTTLIGMKGEEVSPYPFFNLSFLIFVLSIIIPFIYFCVWLYVKNAPPLVFFKSEKWSDSVVEIMIENKEKSAIVDLSMKIVELSCNGISSLYSGKVLETNYPDKVVTYGKFNFASVKEGFLFIKFSDYIFSNVLSASVSEKTSAKYEIIAEFFGRVENEKEIVSLGKYYLLLLQERRFEDGVIKEAIGLDKLKALTPYDVKLFQKNVSLIGGGV